MLKRYHLIIDNVPSNDSIKVKIVLGIEEMKSISLN